MFNANHNNFIKDKLKEISKKNQFRDIIATERKRYNQVFRGNKKYISFSCNDYLSLSLNRKVINASVKASKKYGAGAGASRLITGSNPLYNKLEVLLTKFKKVEACCIFGSGYLANLGVISALSSKDDLILIDEFSHSSTYLGTKLTNSKIVKYQHNDMDDLEDKLKKYRKKYKKCSIITEGIFSMDGDISPQDKISMLSKKYNAFFILDDAHGLGVVGDGTGSNTIFKKENIKIDVYIGTLSKSIGSYGGFVCGSKHLINFLINRCRTQIYTTGLPPSVLAASIEAINIIKLKKNLFKKPLNNAKYFCDLIGLDVPESPIVPIIFKDEKKTLAIANYLMKKGFLVGAIRPPTVPANSSRLRLAFNASHTKSQIKKLAKNIKIFI